MQSLSVLSKQSRPLFIGRLGFWNIWVSACVPAVIHMGHPGHSYAVQGFPAQNARQGTPGRAILPGPLNYQRPELSIGPVNKTGGTDPLSFCLLLQTRQNYAFGATVKRVFSRPIRDTGGAEHPHQPRSTQCTFGYSECEFLMSSCGAWETSPHMYFQQFCDIHCRPLEDLQPCSEAGGSGTA